MNSNEIIGSLYLLRIQVVSLAALSLTLSLVSGWLKRTISAAMPPSHSWKPAYCLPERSWGARVIFLLHEKKTQAASFSLHLHFRQKAMQAANAHCLKGTTPGSDIKILSALEMRQPSYTRMQILNQHTWLTPVLYLHKRDSCNIPTAVWILSEKPTQRKKTFPKLNLFRW